MSMNRKSEGTDGTHYVPSRYSYSRKSCESKGNNGDKSYVSLKWQRKTQQPQDGETDMNHSIGSFTVEDEKSVPQNVVEPSQNDLLSSHQLATGHEPNELEKSYAISQQDGLNDEDGVANVSKSVLGPKQDDYVSTISEARKFPIMKGPALRQGNHTWKRPQVVNPDFILKGDSAMPTWSNANIHDQRTKINEVYKQEGRLPDDAGPMRAIGLNKLVARTSSTWDQATSLSTNKRKKLEKYKFSIQKNPINVDASISTVNEVTREGLAGLNKSIAAEASKRGQVPLPSTSRLEEVGYNKLILRKKSVKEDASDSTITTSSRPEHAHKRRKEAFHDGHLASSLPIRSAPKRIKLLRRDAATTNCGAEENLDEAEGIESASKGKNNDASTVADAFNLTDHAYLETSSQSRHFNNQTWVRLGQTRNSTYTQPRTMGLVRAPSNASKTPVCNLFLRGVVCNDESCLKRHDVPKEFALPVCSFFQHQGMCWKQDSGACPFRHVKINPHATECPSFRLLGYCENEECVMMHSRKHLTYSR